MSDANDSNQVCAAFSAGWLISQVYGPLLDEKNAEATSSLPTINELSGDDRLRLAVHELEKVLAEGLEALFEKGEIIQTMLSAVRGLDFEKSAKDLRDAIEKLHCKLLEALVVAGHDYGTAYMLGKSLSDTCTLVESTKSLRSQFNRYRVANIQSWLSNTADLFPEFSAQVVSRSLAKWSEWVLANEDLQWDEQKMRVKRPLRIQGEHWRALLSGDKDPKSLLSVEGYVAAAELALGRTGHILWKVAARFWFLLLVALGVTAVAAYLSITYGAGTAKVWTFAVSVITGLGATGKGLEVAAKRLAVSAGTSLFSASEEEVISAEILWLPHLKRSWLKDRKLRRQGIVIRSLDDSKKQSVTE